MSSSWLNIGVIVGGPFDGARVSVLPLPRPAIPANARILVSRNKREGGYIGWRKLGPSQRFPDWDGQRPGHQRLGNELMWSTLRARSRP